MESSKIQNAREEAKRALHGYINENQLGYNGYLIDKMKKILSKKGIEWEPENEGIVTDYSNEEIRVPDTNIKELTKVKKENLFKRILKSIKKFFKNTN